MAKTTEDHANDKIALVRWPLRLTFAGLLAENVWKAVWPLFSAVLAVLAVLMLGLHETVSVELFWAACVVAGGAVLGGLYYAAQRFEMPRQRDALDRLDATMKGRPIQAMLDEQAIGADDSASEAVWRAHQARMTERARGAKAVPANMRIADRDPYALRFVAALLLAVALLFGSFLRIGSVTDMAPQGPALASGPVWEGWAESPRYTGRPTIYLNDIEDEVLDLPVGSLITLRFYGEAGALSLRETVSGQPIETGDPSAPEQDFVVRREGEIAITGPGGRTWTIALVPDSAPEIAILEDPDSTAYGEMTLPFTARDDYGVEAGEAIFELNLPEVERAHGLAIDPEPREALRVSLPMPPNGKRTSIQENLIEDFSEHPWANLPVTVRMTALDAAEQQSESVPRDVILPGRRFFDPLAAAIIEQRRDLLWSRGNADRISMILRAVSYIPGDVFRKETDAMKYRQILRRLETLARYGITDEQQDDLARDLWDLALIIEEGDLAGALERLRQAQERLNQAMREGASQAEIERLMDELRRATDDYLQQLSRQAQLDQELNEENPRQQQDPNAMQMTQDDIQRMMDRIQELMEQGRMAEAEEAMRELQELLENLRMTQGQQGQGGENPGQQAMEGLAETLREQQGLSDQAFRDLQEQFNPNAQTGESQGNEGRDGGQGRGEQHSQNGQGGGEGQQEGQNGNQGGQQSTEESLADRQQALRDELRRQQQNLPGSGTPEGQAANDALDRAGRAMDQAEDALRERDFAEAIENQSDAMEALREGMRALGEQMAQQQQESQPGQGDAQGDRMADARDPLGRRPGTGGETGTDQQMLQGEDVYRRARDLLDEIRRRASEGQRPDVELDYLKRLLDRF